MVSSWDSTCSRPMRVRFAPSPSGTLHIGGARTALFNYIMARRSNGTFIVRVEDTDQGRSSEASESSVLADLQWLGLNWDEGPFVGGPSGPYRCSERLEHYRDAANRLLASGRAYPCFCSRESLETKRKAALAARRAPHYDGTCRDLTPAEVRRKLRAGLKPSIRFRVGPNRRVGIVDGIKGPKRWYSRRSCGDFLLMRPNGFPLYNFGVVVDDGRMNVTHVVRATDHVGNTLKQCLVFEALGQTPPRYAHCSLVLGSDGGKLSKRHGATGVGEFRRRGFLPESLLQYLAAMGTPSGIDLEAAGEGFNRTSPDHLRAFDMAHLRSINRKAVKFDQAALEGMNRRLLRGLSGRARTAAIGEFLAARGATNATAGPFVDAAGLLCRGEPMTTLEDALKLVERALAYDRRLVSARLGASAFERAVARRIVGDVDAGRFPHPKGDLGDFSRELGRWLGRAASRVDGHDCTLEQFAKSARGVLTGRDSGPNLRECLWLVTQAQGWANCEVQTLQARVEALRRWL